MIIWHLFHHIWISKQTYWSRAGLSVGAWDRSLHLQLQKHWMLEVLWFLLEINSKSDVLQPVQGRQLESVFMGSKVASQRISLFFTSSCGVCYSIKDLLHSPGFLLSENRTAIMCRCSSSCWILDASAGWFCSLISAAVLKMSFHHHFCVTFALELHIQPYSEVLISHRVMPDVNGSSRTWESETVFSFVFMLWNHWTSTCL